jgi:hypothetical protein
MDLKEARGIVEDAKRRGLIRAPGDPGKPEARKPEPSDTVLPDWLQEGLLRPPPRE